MFERAVIVGTGAGGAAVAKELQGKFLVTILEEGGVFHPSSKILSMMEILKKTGIFFSEKQIRMACPIMKIRKTKPDKLVFINGSGIGGTTTISAGCAMRMDEDLVRLGINLDPEFEKIYNEIPVHTSHTERWNKNTRELFDISNEMELAPEPVPHMTRDILCMDCGQCTLGCPRRSLWDSRQYLRDALDSGAKLVNYAHVEKIIIKDNKATGVQARIGWSSEVYPADLVIVSAGALNTPVILQNSGIECEPRLFANPITCVAAHKPNSHQDKEIPIPFIIRRNDWIIAPYFDHISYFFNSAWKYPAKDIVSLMVKVLDMSEGTVINTGGKTIEKTLMAQDKKRLADGIKLSKEILAKMGIEKDNIFTGTLMSWVQAGSFPLTEKTAKTFHHEKLPDNVYVADASLLPASAEKFPILTIIALAKRIAHICKENFGNT